MELADGQLLAAFVEERSEGAFARLVERYSNLVFSAARRQVADPGLAEDVTQAVFVILARRAARLRERPVLAGWLVQTARYVALKANIIKARREKHEGKAAAMKEQEAGRRHQASEAAEVVDGALVRLGAQERDVVVMRYLQQKSFGEISAAMGISEAAAQKRSLRALEKLRSIFARRGVAVEGRDIGALMAALPAFSVPSGLSAKLIAGGASGGTTVGSATVLAKGTMHMVTWMKLQCLGAVAAGVVVAATTGTLIVHQALAQAPTTLPATAESSPLDPIIDLNRSLQANDSQGYQRVHPKMNTAEESFSNAVENIIKTQSEFVAAYRDKFGAAAPLAPELVYLKAVPEDRLRQSKIVLLDDHTADVDTPDGMKYRVVKTDNHWLIALQDTIGRNYKIDVHKEMAALNNMFRKIGAAYTVTGAEIKAGLRETPDAAASALLTRLNEAYAAAPGAEDQQIEALPLPCTIPNSSFKQVEWDTDARRTPASEPPVHLTVGATSLYRFTNIGPNSPNNFNLDPIRGKRVQLSAWVKTQDVRNFAGVTFVVFGPGTRQLSVDDNNAHPLQNTTDWTQLKFVAYVPQETRLLTIAPMIYGPGEMWLDDCKLEIVPDTTPLTDDQNWHSWSMFPRRYRVEPDPNELRNNKPAICINGLQGGSWCSYDFNNRFPEKYRGHRIRVTAWIKSEDVARPAGIRIRVIKGGNSSLIADEGGARPIRGTTDWTQYTAIADVPMDTENIDVGVQLMGRGKLWLDVDSVKCELTDDPAPPSSPAVKPRQ